MAKFNVVGLDDIQEKMLTRDKATEAAVPEMLQAGGEVLRKAQSDEVLLTFKSRRSTGALANSIKVSTVQEKDGGKSVEVYPDGTDKHGVRNAEKAFGPPYG